MLRRADSGQRGFSLLELMITVALLSVLVMAVMPDIGAWMRGLQIRHQAEAIQTGLQRARNEAVRRNRDVQFSLVSLSDPSKMDNTCALSTSSASWVISLESPQGKCGASVSDVDEPKLLASSVAGAEVSKVKILAEGDGTSAANAVTYDSYGRMKGNLEPIRQITIETAENATDARKLRIILSAAGNIRMCDLGVTATGDPRKC